MDQVIVVDTNDSQIATMEKMEAHKKAVLHRAVSVFICNSKGEWILQRRATGKYHSNGLWSNTACTHPFPDESNIKAANRRLIEEMGMKADLIELFNFIYKEKLDHDLTEHEFDHVFYGISDETPIINTNEVMDWKYIRYNDLSKDISENPDKYTIWFKKIVGKVNNHITEKSC